MPDYATMAEVKAAALDLLASPTLDISRADLAAIGQIAHALSTLDYLSRAAIIIAGAGGVQELTAFAHDVIAFATAHPTNVPHSPTYADWQAQQRAGR